MWRDVQGVVKRKVEKEKIDVEGRGVTEEQVRGGSMEICEESDGE